MKRDMGLRTRLVIVVLAAILPLFGLSLVGAVLSTRQAVSRASANLAFSASLVAAAQQKTADATRQTLTAIANTPGLLDTEGPACERYFKVLHDQLGLYANLGIIGLDGQLRCDSLANNPVVFAGDRQYFLDALASGTFVSSGYLVGRTSGKPTMNFAMPMLDGAGKPRAVAFAGMPLSALVKIADVPVPHGSRLLIADRFGTVLTTSPPNPAAIGQPLPSTLLRDALKAGVEGVREGVDEAGARQIYAFLPSAKSPDAPFFVVISADWREVVAPAHQRLALVLLALVLAVLFGSWLAWRMGGRAIVLPAAKILAATRQLEAGQLDVRVALDTFAPGGEFSLIAASFNQMSEALQRREDDLKIELGYTQRTQLALEDAQRLQAKSYIELRHSQHKLLEAQRLGGMGPWELDVASQHLTLSSELQRLLGLLPDAFDGCHETYTQTIHPGDRAHYAAQLDAARRADKPLDVEYRIITPDGAVRWVHQQGTVQLDAAGQPVCLTGLMHEITTRKLAEQALMESEHRYTALFETAPVPMWVVDVDTGQFLMANSAAAQAYGYTHEELLSMTLLDIRPTSEHERLRKDLAAGIPGSERKNTWLHRRKDGSTFPVSVFAKAIKYGDKTLRFVVALDVTAEVKAEHDAREHLFMLQRAADAAQAITWHLTLGGTLQEVAEQARGVIGAHQAIVSLAADGNGLAGVIAASLSEKYTACRDTIKAIDGAAIYAPMSESNHSVRMTQAELEAHPRWRGYRAQAGTEPTMRGWLAVPLMSRSGTNMGLLQLSDKYDGEFTLQDEYVAIELAQLASIALQNAQLIQEVSQLNAGLERKVAERTVALARQEALFRALAEQAPQVVWTVNPEGAITYFNRAWLDLVGGQAQDWSGTRWFDAMHPEDLPGILANWEAARASGLPFMGIRRVRAKTGFYHTMSYRASPVLTDEGEVAFWVGIDADITEIKTVEAALRLSNQELEAFAYSVSHDLRSPLNTIDGFSRLLSKYVDGDAQHKAQHYLSRIQAGVAQMGRLIEDLLSLSQVSRMQLRYEEVDLSALSHRILDDWRGRQPERQVSAQIEDGLKVTCDGRLVRVLMENLLGNAWKFTSKQPQASIQVGQTLDAAGQPEFFIRDNGVGFDMAYADKLFVAFQRLHAVSEFPGTGIGLATVSRVVSRHGGSIRTASSPGHGATFFFTLPPMVRGT